MFVEVKDPEDKVSWPLPALDPASSKLWYFFVSFHIYSIEKDSWCCGKMPDLLYELGPLLLDRFCSQLFNDR